MGQDRTLVLYLTQMMRRGQSRGDPYLWKRAYCLLNELKRKLANPRARKKTKEQVQNKVTEILKGEGGQELIKVSIQDKGSGRFDIDWELDTDAYSRVTEEIWGKKILVTSQDDWSEQEIIAAYHGQKQCRACFQAFEKSLP